MQNIAFIGLGNMGAPMARNLLAAGFKVSVFDLAPAAVAALAQAGATAAGSAADAVRQADAVITMLPANQHVQDLYLAAGGVLDTAAPGALLIDCSTIAADVARQVSDAAQARGFAMLDAPVSGGTAGAAAGTLTFIVGGAAEALERARPLLEKMGKNIFHAGGAGAGQVAKICNNMLLGILMAGTAEALNLGVAHGLDPKVLSDIMAKSSGRNWTLEVYNPWPGVMETAPASRNYSGGFGTALMLKDLGLAQQSALSAHAATPLGGLTRQLFQMHQQNGHGQLDFSSIVQLFHPVIDQSSGKKL
ncbi:3-hydroxyisobutyrate dehydrogenase [Janthinobacterium agaricidamnosum]|uniref:3-hydroxyisobutyrate dehydrogenase n=1 Tax=Janthinobacterium agaricidamnosum NBRC 102515 = DSM 9628 TaxID=1349767 RepID=W0UZJ6_9BURK|nr:3-hydroxyisobutyrate dehydrogenase [Janthinobacterium agaricidamnosum]CDG81051.1 3-hydroxyisobutyrate dehydrogenase [Janthinobacterium agaricidamnosum NBRC 102515 = DSM 9628]